MPCFPCHCVEPLGSLQAWQGGWVSIGKCRPYGALYTALDKPRAAVDGVRRQHSGSTWASRNVSYQIVAYVRLWGPSCFFRVVAQSLSPYSCQSNSCSPTFTYHNDNSSATMPVTTRTANSDTHPGNPVIQGRGNVAPKQRYKQLKKLKCQRKL